MKKILLISALGLFACGKIENKIQGTWIMKEMKLHDQTDWFQIPSTEEPVLITNDSIGNPWASKYHIIDKNKMQFFKNGEYIKIDIKKDNMTFTLNGDSLKLVRL